MVNVLYPGLSSTACHGPVLFHFLHMFLATWAAALDVVVLGFLHRRDHAVAI